MSEQASTRPSVVASLAASARPVGFASSQSNVSPAPWLVDGGKLSVRTLFPKGRPEDGLSGESELAAAHFQQFDLGAHATLSSDSALESQTADPQVPPVAESASLSVVPPAWEPSGDAFARAVAEHATARARALVLVEEQLLELAVQLAEVLVEREIAREPEILGVLLRSALAALEGNQPSVVSASRAAYTAIVETFGGPQVEVDGTKVCVVLDARLEGLGVVVEGSDARVDGRVSERLRSALRAMQDAHRARKAEAAS